MMDRAVLSKALLSETIALFSTMLKFRSMRMTALLLLLCMGIVACRENPMLMATLAGCSDGSQSLHDNGELLYVIFQEECEPSFPAKLTVEYKENRTVESTFTEFGQEQYLEIPGLGKRKVGLFKRGFWRSFPNKDTWAGRDGAGLLQLNNKLYLLGGWLYGPVTNEVWVTSDLEKWEFLGHAPWQPRHGAAWLVHNNKLWVIGGDLIDDVWSSSDGVQWTLETQSAPFGKRYTPNAVSLGGMMYLYAGQYWEPVEWCSSRPDCKAVGFNDVWQSRDGRTWSRINSGAPWAPRGLVHGAITWQGEMFVIGGGLKVPPPNERHSETVAEFSDIWSSPDGIIWRKRSNDFKFPARTHFSVTTTPSGCFVSDGSIGSQINVSNDLFFSKDCVNYGMVMNPPHQKRHASSMVYFNGSLIILGGPPYGGADTTVWQYFF